MNNVVTMNPNVNEFAQDLVEEIPKWVTSMVARGVYPSTRGSNATTALAGMVSILAADEPRTIGYVLENIEAIAQRWALKNAAKPDTARTYQVRAKSVLEHYLAYKSNPLTFKVDVRAPSEDREGKKTASRKAAAEPAAPPATPPTPPSAAPLTQRKFHIGGGRHITFDVPEDMTQKEFKRFVYHVLPMCVDFDPDGVPGFGITRAPE